METGKAATLLIATAVAESGRRWSHRLRETFAVCEVAEREALEQVMANLRPHVLVLDLTLPQLGRVEGLPSIQQLSLSTKTLVLTDAPTDSEGISALKAGAKGYWARAIDPAQLEKALELVQKGEFWVQRRLIVSLVAEIMSLAERRQEDPDGRLDSRVESLTDRQRVVADLISKGVSNKEIARRLNITERTVKAHLTEMFRNLGVPDRLHLALFLNGYARLYSLGCVLPEALEPWQGVWWASV